MSDIKIGDKIKLKSNVKGIVKFIGEIHVSKGIFYGIELDTPDGKTNGTLNNVCYFICREKHGLFARFSQLIKLNEDEVDTNIKGISKTNPCNEDKDEEIVYSTDKENYKTVPKSGLPVLNKANPQKISNNPTSILQSKLPLTEMNSLEIMDVEANKDSVYRNPCRVNEPSYSNEQNVKNIIKTQNPTVQQNNDNEQEHVRSTTKESITIMKSQMESTSLLGSNASTNKPDINVKYVPTQINSTNAESFENKSSCQRCSELEIDCEEKIETFKLLKKKDRIKIVSLEKSNSDLLARVSENSELLEKIKEERENIKCEYDNYRETMHLTEEDVESLTMDKELAEENCEIYRQELDQLKVQFDQLSEENRMLIKNKEEGYIQNENCPIINKYRNAIIELKIIIDKLKVDNDSISKELEISLEKQLSFEIENETIQIENMKFQEDVREMKEFIDSTSDAIQIIDNLTEKNEHLESEVATLERRVLELDEANDQALQGLEDKSREIKLLRTENASFSHNIETLKSELSSTLCKQSEQGDLSARFREKVQGLENEIVILRSELQSKEAAISRSRDYDRRCTIMAGVQKHSIYSDFTKIINDKLKELELRQKVQLVNIMERYLVETFTNSDGHRDMFAIVLMVDRYLEKISIILTYIEDKKKIVDTISYNKTEVMTFHKKLEFLLSVWSHSLNQLKRNLYQCDPDNLNSIISHNTSLKSHEQRIDTVLSWIQKDCFDESRNLKDLEVSIEYFRHFFEDAFPSPSVDYNQKIGDFVRVINAGSQCLDSSMQWIGSIVAKKSYENSQFKDLSDCLTKFIVEMQSKVLGMYKHLKHLPRIQLSRSSVYAMDEAVLFMSSLIESVTQFCDEMSTDKISSGDTMSRLLEIFSQCFKSSSTDSAMQVMSHIRTSIVELANCLDNGLYDISPKQRENSATIVDKSVKRYRENLSRLRGLARVVELKETQIQQLNVALSDQSEKLGDSTLSMEHVKSKLSKAMQTRSDEVELLNHKILDALEDIDAKQNMIASLESKISTLNERILALENAPVDIVKIESNDVNNKEGFVTEIRILKNTVSSLNLKMNRLRGERVKAMVGELESLKLVQSKQRTLTEGCLDKADSISYEVFARLSTIEIPSLTRNVSNYVTDQRLARSALKRKVESLGSAYLARMKRVSLVL